MKDKVKKGGAARSQGTSGEIPKHYIFLLYCSALSSIFVFFHLVPPSLNSVRRGGRFSTALLV